MKKRVLMFVLSVFLASWVLPVEALGASEVTATFSVINGTWSGSSEPRRAAFEVGHVLCPEDIPTDMTPSDGFGGGRWQVEPVGVRLESNMTFKFYYQALTQVSFEASGGAFEDGSSACVRQVPVGGCCQDFPDEPKRSGYAFAGWATESGKPFSREIPVNRPTTVYASWRENRILILDANGGSWAQPQQVELPGGLLEEDALPEPPERDGWEFDHWNLQPDGKGQSLPFGTLLQEHTSAYAQWRRIFILHLDGDSEDSSAELEYIGEKPGILAHDFTLPDLARPGHRLLGWEDDAGKVLAVGDMYTVGEGNNPATLHARWERLLCQVAFDGTGIVRDCLWGDALGELPQPQPPEEGTFRFGGWHTAPEGKGSLLTAETPVTENLTVYPHWIPRAKVVFQIVGGIWAESKTERYALTLDVGAPLADKLPTPVPDPVYKAAGTWDKLPVNASDGAVFTFTCQARQVFQVTFDTGDPPVEVLEGDCTMLPIPSQAGARFSGWFTAKVGGEAFDETTAVSQNTALYARWIPVFTLSYDPNGGENAPASEVADVVEGKCSFTVSDEVPTREGYSFEGWADSSGAELAQFHGGDSCAAAGDLVLYAVWKKDNNQVTVTFFDRGTECAKRTLTAGEPLGPDIPQAPYRENYQFLGWNLKEDGTGEILTKDTVISRSTDFYACWQKIPRATVIFIDRGRETDWFTLNAGDCVGDNMPPDPTRKGFTFAGWRTENGTPLDASTPVAQDMTVYASWDKITRGTITFLDGDTEVYRITLDLGAKIGDHFPADPERPGFRFLGWNTREDGTGSKLYRSTTLREDLTVWAQWEEIEYVQLTFYNVFGDTRSLTLEQNTKAGDQFPSNPSRPGYTFKGWFTDLNGEGKKVTKSTKIQEDTDLFAYWRPKDSTNAQTGDDPDIYLWAALLLSSGTALYFLVTRNGRPLLPRKKNHKYIRK